jgi:hypothetical protein
VKKKLYKCQPGKEPIDNRIFRYLSTWPEGLSTVRMSAWIQSCTREGGYTLREFDDGLRRLRDSGRIAIANGIWYIRSTLQKDK